MNNWKFRKERRAEVFELEVEYVNEENRIAIAFIETIHKGYRKTFNNWRVQSKSDLIDCMVDTLKDATKDNSGFIPYNNFESSVNWDCKRILKGRFVDDK